MITYSKLGQMGRFGNQLFQIAATIALAHNNNDEAVFPYWEYNYLFKKQLSCISDFSWVKSVYKEPQFEYASIPYLSDMDLRDSYLQSEKYFAGCSNLIRDQFDFLDNSVSDEKLGIAKDACSIHIRRTDYLKFPEYHPFPGMPYYLSAITDMERYGIRKFLIFSDDIQWCMSTFGSHEKFVYIQNQTNVQDMCLMSKCHSNIIANSSFSWWGAWLNKNENRRIIAPAKWFGPANNATPKDLYCDGWTVK